MRFFAGISLFVFVLTAILLTLIVLIQNDQGEGMGGLFSGSSSSPFGGQGSNALQKITGTLALLFFVSAVGYGLTTKARYSMGLETSVQQQNESATSWWKDAAKAMNSAQEQQTALFVIIKGRKR